MTLKDLVSKLRIKTNIELTEDNNYLCNTISDSKVLELYGKYEVIDWYSNKMTDEYKPIININIKGECKE